jgi:hypothetical protein
MDRLITIRRDFQILIFTFNKFFMTTPQIAWKKVIEKKIIINNFHIYELNKSTKLTPK